MLLLAAAGWAGAGTGRWCGWWVVAAAGASAAVLWPLLRRRHRSLARTVAGALLVVTAVGAVTTLRADQVARSPVARLAADGAAVGLVATVTSDPHQTQGRYGVVVTVRLDVREVTGRGTTYALSAPVLVLADEGWLDLPLGATIHASGRLGPADDGDLAAVLAARGPPETLAAPGVWWRGAAVVRASIRASVEHRPADQRALVPALVDGDDAGLDDGLADDFRTTGLTHLLAVSGTNLTLVVGFLLVLARWAGCVVGGCSWSARRGSSGSCCSPAPSRACCGRR